MTTQITTCRACGAELTAAGQCLACLLRIGLDAAGRTESTNRLYGDFEIALREDGSWWELGRGAMGVTYRAIDRVLHRAVALKIVETPGEASRSPMVRERFLREARGAAGLHHPNVAEVFQFGTVPTMDRAFYAMELIEGETLEARMRRDGPLTPRAALDVAVPVARALVAAAERDLVHRDLKPSNIMLRTEPSERAQVVVIDFGLVRTLVDRPPGKEPGRRSLVGTPIFASPEQLCGEPVDARSDIYSLGATLWFALTGDVPFPGRTIDEITRRHRKEALPWPQLATRKIPRPLATLLRQMLSIDPASRPASAPVLLTALEACRRTLENAARRQRLRWTSYVVGTVCLVGIAATWPHWNRSIRDAPAPVARVEGRATDNPAAYRAYVEGLALISRDSDSGEIQAKALADFSAAVRLDPGFALAWARRSIACSALLWGGDDQSGRRLIEAKQSLDAATRINPELGEVFLARGYFHYHIERHFDEAKEDFSHAAERMPNSAEAYVGLGLVQRRQGLWDDALASFAKAARVDPLSIQAFASWNTTCLLLGRYLEAREILDRELAIRPDDPRLIAFKARTYQMEGDLPRAAALLQPLPLLPLSSTGRQVQLDQWFYERHFDKVIDVSRTSLENLTPAERSLREDIQFDLGKAQFYAGDVAAADTLRHLQATLQWEAIRRADDWSIFTSLALVESMRQHASAAPLLAARAVSLPANDGLNQAHARTISAQVYALLGDAAGATARLRGLLKTPGTELSPGCLALDPVWDRIRADPRFIAISGSPRAIGREQR